MIMVGQSHHLAVDIILTVSEIDEIVKWYGIGNTEYDKKLLDKLKTTAKAIRFSGVRRIGYIDESRSSCNLVIVFRPYNLVPK